MFPNIYLITVREIIWIWESLALIIPVDKLFDNSHHPVSLRIQTNYFPIFQCDTEKKRVVWLNNNDS